MKQQYPLTRRNIIKTIGAGTALSVVGVGPAAASRGKCPECASGTGLLAKFEFDDDGGEFFFEEGACSDAVSDISYVDREDEENEPVKVDFTSPIFVDDVVVKYGPHCTRASESDAVTFTQDGEKDGDGFEGFIELADPDDPAISHFSLCAGVCYQVDFVFGEVADDPTDYRGRLISVRWDGTNVDGGEFENLSPAENREGDEVVTDLGVELSSDETTASVTYDVDPNSDDVTLTLVSYAATCPPDFDEDTAHIQDLVDAKTVTYTSSASDEYLEVELPGLGWLDDLCDI